MKTKLIQFLGVAVLFASCSPKYYSPNTQNVPGISEKDQFSGFLGGSTNQYEVQAAYGVSNNLGVQLNAGMFLPKDLDNGNGGSGKFGELGAGYFTKVGENFVFETYVLGGLGNVENHLPSTIDSAKTTTGKINAGLTRFSVQPAFAWVTANLSIILSTRVSSINYSNIEGSLIYQNEDQVKYLNNNKSMMLAEPALTVRAGSRGIQFQAQFGSSMNLTNSEFLQEKSWLTFGVNFRLQNDND
jgi:hypothetical protein